MDYEGDTLCDLKRKTGYLAQVQLSVAFAYQLRNRDIFSREITIKPKQICKFKQNRKKYKKYTY